jgi:hypothetical protein
MTDRAYSMTTYEIYVVAPKDPAFDWHAGKGGGLEDLHLNVRVARGLQAMLAMVRAIDEGRLEGRQLDWGAWIGPIDPTRLDDVMNSFGWPRTSEIDDLDPNRAYYLVAVET